MHIGADAKEAPDHVRTCLSTPVTFKFFLLAAEHPGMSRYRPDANKSNRKTSSRQDMVSCEVGPVGLLFLKLL